MYISSSQPPPFDLMEHVSLAEISLDGFACNSTFASEHLFQRDEDPVVCSALPPALGTC